MRQAHIHVCFGLRNKTSGNLAGFTALFLARTVQSFSGAALCIVTLLFLFFLDQELPQNYLQFMYQFHAETRISTDACLTEPGIVVLMVMTQVLCRDDNLWCQCVKKELDIVLEIAAKSQRVVGDYAALAGRHLQENRTQEGNNA